MSTTALIDVVHLSEAEGSDVRVQLLHGLDERALGDMRCPGLQLAQTKVIPQAIIPYGTRGDLGKDGNSVLILSYLA